LAAALPILLHYPALLKNQKVGQGIFPVPKLALKKPLRGPLMRLL
jgi:hypothetical protein